MLFSWMAIMIIVGSLIEGEQLTLKSFLNYYFATALGSKYTSILWFFEHLLAIYLIYPILKLLFDKHAKMYSYLFAVIIIQDIIIQIQRRKKCVY